MKGIVFTEFLELVEEKFGANMMDDIIDAADLPSQGAYTAVGTYDHEEILRLVVALSQRVDIPVAELVHFFGRYLFQRFIVIYPEFFIGITDAFDFLAGIESRVHSEVLKLYPEAELPSFEYHMQNARTLQITYRSKRPFAELAAGLIDGCIAHFGEHIDVSRESLPCQVGQHERFTLVKQ